MSARRLTAFLTIALATAALGAPGALADADPASDVLLGSSVFFPYSPPVSVPLQTQLIGELGRLEKKGLNLKVAIIASPIDLGAIPNMFGHPQAYATFLGREISFNQAQPLLVVMPNGFGLYHVGASSALSGLKPDASGHSDSLTRSAIVAVQRISEAVGKPVTPGKATGSGGTSVSPLIAFGGPAVLVLLGALVATRLSRRRAEPSG